MAKLNVTRIAIAAGVGVVDELLERQDVKAVRTGAKGWSFMYRVAAVAGGFGLQMFMPKYGGIGETVALSATPLMVKSIASLAMPVAGRPMTRSFPRMSPVARGIGARAPEFDKVRMV